MPKMKTNRGAVKRFKRTGTGKLKRAAANRRHILIKKAKKRKRHLRGLRDVHPSDVRSVKEMLRVN
ncbi:MAG: 50S ribosomal protein L35 [Coxiella sp. RIFCSPHIGHO2_12_FULL_42_15]|nr:MAG: 50S ribosomal protein L35 [Coxiella sp. RIFCSPHIGHO2_12_FULL_42_15]